MTYPREDEFEPFIDRHSSVEILQSKQELSAESEAGIGSGVDVSGSLPAGRILGSLAGRGSDQATLPFEFFSPRGARGGLNRAKTLVALI